MCALAHETLLSGIRTARFQLVTLNGSSEAISAELDAPLVFTDGVDYGTRFRLDTMSSITADIENPATGGPDVQTNLITFLSPVPAADSPQTGDLITVGVRDIETTLITIRSIQHGPNLIHSKVPLRTFEDFAGKKIRYPGGIVAEVFSAAGVSTVLLPGGEIYPALEKGVIDAADYVGAAINWNLGFAEVTKYIVLPSLHQPVDLMDVTVNMKSWNALPNELQEMLIAAVKWHSWDQWSAIHEADRLHYRKFAEAGTEIITLPPAEIDKFRKVAIPLWYKWAKKDAIATRAFKIWLNYMLDTGFIERRWLAGYSI
ncbi:MAG: TRAP transporter substrate-binding protein DctP [SAR324 cluster bacterium]|nr:TRAP transporter substrate-binding protein DctP [SAR324 cluster bacterium]